MTNEKYYNKVEEKLRKILNNEKLSPQQREMVCKALEVAALGRKGEKDEKV